MSEPEPHRRVRHARAIETPNKNTFYFLPFKFGAGGFYALHPFDIEFGHQFRILCTYTGVECWPSRRGVDAVDIEWPDIDTGLRWLLAPLAQELT